MPIYILVGPAAALIGIVSIFFVMRNRSTQKKSMYSSRRAQIERKVHAQRQRTLAPRGRGDKPPTAAEIAAAAPAAPSTPIYEAPPRQAWEAPAAPPPAYTAPAAPPAPAYEPPPAPSFEPAAEPSPFTAAPAEAPSSPEWATPAPGEPAWNPAPAPPMSAPAPDFTTPAPAPAPDYLTPRPAEPTVTAPAPAGGGASWEVVGGGQTAPAEPAAAGKQGGDQATGSSWQLSSGGQPTEGAEDGEEEAVKKPSAAVAVAQYAVLVVGLVMVLIGVLVMVANSKVT